MGEQTSLFGDHLNPLKKPGFVRSEGVQPITPSAAPVLVVADAGGTVRFTVEGQPARRYGAHKGGKPRGVTR